MMPADPLLYPLNPPLSDPIAPSLSNRSGLTFRVLRASPTRDDDDGDAAEKFIRKPHAMQLRSLQDTEIGINIRLSRGETLEFLFILVTQSNHSRPLKGASLCFTTGTLNLAQPSIRSLGPALAVHRLGGIEEALGIILVLDRLQRLVVAPKELLLEVLLPRVALVHVRAAARRHRLDRRHDCVGHELAALGHEPPLRRVKRPLGRQRNVHESLAPRRKNRVGAVGAELGHVGAHADPRDALLRDALGRGVQLGGRDRALEDLARDEAAAVLRDADLDGAVGERAKVLVIVVVVVGRLRVRGGMGDVEGVELGDKGGDDLADLGLGLSVGRERRDHEEGGGEVVDNHRAGADHARERGVEGVDAGPELVLRDRGGEEGEGHAANLLVRECLGRQADNDTIVAATAARERPVQVRVTRTRRREEAPVGRDDFVLERVVGRQAEARAESRMSATLGVTASEANRRALARHHHLALGLGRREDLEALHTGADLDGGAGVEGVGEGLEVDALEVVGPDGQGSGTGRATKVVVAGVANDKANVVLLGKGNRLLDVVAGLGLDGVADVVAQHAGLGGGREGVTALVQKVGSHDGGAVGHVDIGELPAGLEGRAGGRVEGRVVADVGQGHRGDEAAADRRVEGAPLGRGRPARVAGEALAAAGGGTTGRQEAGHEGGSLHDDDVWEGLLKNDETQRPLVWQHNV